MRTAGWVTVGGMCVTGKYMVGSALAAAMVMLATPAAAQDDGQILRDYLASSYPSLAYVDRYRQMFPDEIQGNDSAWHGREALPMGDRTMLADYLLALQDQHVALAGPAMGPTESLGVLFRTASDGSMLVWRIFRSDTGLQAGDIVTAIDGMPTALWLERAARSTFGGNRRSRAAEAALNFGVASRGVHAMLGLGDSVRVVVQRGDMSIPLEVHFAPLEADAGEAVWGAVNRPDLPPRFVVQGLKIGTLRLGAFAPQFDPNYLRANAAAEATPGVDEDQAMVQGFCAAVQAFIADADAIARDSDLLVLDLRGNMGGFGRYARLLSMALVEKPLPQSFDLLHSAIPGMVSLRQEPVDPSCGRIAHIRPLIVLTDAGTRSAGELMAAWLWGAGAIVAGERTIGAGGGFEFGSAARPLPQSGYAVRISGNFTLFDGTGTLHDGNIDEAHVIDTISTDHFAPSRERYFAIQAAGMRPDIAAPSTASDFADGGIGQVGRIVAQLQAQGKLPRGGARPHPGVNR